MKKMFIAVILILSGAEAAIGANTWPMPGGFHGLGITATARTSAGTIPVAPAGLTSPAPAGVTFAATAGVTGTAASAAIAAEAADEGQAAYDSLTVTADFNYRPAFVESKYEKNELFQDIAVSAVEAVPFGFLLTFAGIFVTEAAGQGTIHPQLKTLQDYTPVYAISIGVLAALNIAVNTLFFYDYNKEDSHAKKAEEK